MSEKTDIAAIMTARDVSEMPEPQSRNEALLMQLANGGKGLPAGGETGQALTKNSDRPRDVSWRNFDTVSGEAFEELSDYVYDNIPANTAEILYDLIHGIEALNSAVVLE